MNGKVGMAQLDELQVQLDKLREMMIYVQSKAGRLEESVRSVIEQRRRRDRIFGESLFAEPAWDMFLELYAAELAQQRVSTSKLCDAAAVPPTTALRWIDKLVDSGWLARTRDPLDLRRVFVELTPRARAALERYFGDSV